MKWAGGWEPPKVLGSPVTWAEHRQVWDMRQQIREQRYEPLARRLYDDILMPAEVAEQLAAKSLVESRCPPAHTLASQIPDAVYWLRAQMTARPLPDDNDGGGGSSKPKSKPPFRMAFMNAADREIAALAHWCSGFGLPIPSGLYRVNGTVRGVFTEDHLDAVWEMASTLAGVLRWASFEDELLTDDTFGLWTVRSQHYGLWPQLAAIFESTTTFAAEEAADEAEQLELM